MPRRPGRHRGRPDARRTRHRHPPSDRGRRLHRGGRRPLRHGHAGQRRRRRPAHPGVRPRADRPRGPHPRRRTRPHRGFAGPADATLAPPYAYVECHIEQGPVLAEQGVEIGVVTGVQGISWQEITVHGRAAHAGTTPTRLRADAGLAAAQIVVRLRAMVDSGAYGELRATVGHLTVHPDPGHFLVALEDLGRHLARGPAHPLPGTGTVHASLIRGGEEPSTYPARCRVTLERRTVPGESAARVERELTGLLDRLAATVPDFRYRLARGLHREPFQADPEARIVRTLTRHAAQVLGHPPVVRAEPFWTDCALLDRAGIPCLLFGVDGAGAHAADEYADLASLDRLTDVLTGTIADVCA
ncbi:M20/M25/M40 family metallo-hydrolase [Streptomyces camelliae]|uniref:M20/M25/M40 family metallo-hydrolase n=1 Tax=Streptomyces camelliae TaxID=3004093 RepID=UPI002FD7FBA3